MPALPCTVGELDDVQVIFDKELIHSRQRRGLFQQFCKCPRTVSKFRQSCVQFGQRGVPPLLNGQREYRVELAQARL